MSEPKRLLIFDLDGTLIDSQRDLSAGKQFWPMLQWIDAVERDPDIARYRHLVFGARRKAGREQHAGWIEIWQHRE